MKISSFLVGQPTNKKIVQSDLGYRINMVLIEQRHQRSDLKDIKLMIDKLLVDKHLQMQVDEYFEEDKPVHPEEEKDLD